MKAPADSSSLATSVSEPNRAPLPQPEYPAISVFVDIAQPADVESTFAPLKTALADLKGPRAEQGKKVYKALERTSELLLHLIQVREKIASEGKGSR